MPNTLLLRLPETGAQETEWLTLDESSSLPPTRQRGSLSLAAAVFRTGRVVALAPSTQMLLAEPELPPGSGAKLSKAVPFALEEQLTEDVDQLFFAIGRRRTLGATPVAVVTRSVLQGWLDELKAAGLEPAALYADISLMPENPGQTVLWYEKGRLAVRRPAALPFAVELSPVKEALAVAGVIADPLAAPDAPDAKAPESAILYATRDDWIKVQDEFERLIGSFASLKVQLLADGALPWLARSLGNADHVNLLQGEFARTSEYDDRWRRWRPAALLAVALLFVHLGAQALQLRQARHSSSLLNAQMLQVFAAAMPNEPMREPRRQMQQRLDRIHSSGPGPEHFLKTLQSLSGALAAVPATSIDSMSYREQSLDLQLSAPNLAALSRLSQLIDKDGLRAEIQSSNPSSSGVAAHLQIRPQNSRPRS